MEIRPAAMAIPKETDKLGQGKYGEYPFVSADEIKKALNIKNAFSGMLDQMQ